MALCERCQRFNIQSFSKETFFRTYDLDGVVKANAEGCLFCRSILESLRATPRDGAREWESGYCISIPKQMKFFNDPPSSRVFFWATRSEASLGGGSGLGITHLNVGFARKWLDLKKEESVSFHVAADSGSIALSSGDIVGEIDSGTGPWSDALFNGIKTWHKDCHTYHKTCNQTLSKTQSFDCNDVPLPTRYLEIMPVSRGTRGGTQGQSGLHFVLREAVGLRGRYIALSHRWTEGTRTAMTTKENYLCRTRLCDHHSPCQAWKGGALTELFREACWLAVNLEITKVWIDSICIIQDDPNDWKKESVKMADYYQFAWLTITATHTTPNGGLRRDFTATEIPRLIPLPYRNIEGQQQGYFYAQNISRQSITSDFWERIINSTFMKRGWIFQEQFLSRRNVTFSGTSWGVFMTCQNGDNPKAVTGDQVSTPHPLFVNQVDQLTPSLSSSQVFDQWRTIVEFYSRLEFTQIDQDRVVALSGVATEFENTLQILRSTSTPEPQTESAINICTYSSGMWLNDKFSFLWENNEPQACSRIQGIPTWSWASIMAKRISNGNEQSARGARVFWSTDLSTKCVFQVESALQLPMDSSTWTPLYTGTFQPLPENRYGNESRFSILKMRAKLLQVSVDARFPPDHAAAAAEVTRHSGIGKDRWRGIATYTTPDLVAGWASVEHPEYQDDAACRSAQNIVALLLMESRSFSAASGLGNIFRKHVIFQVLYLRQVENPIYDPCYERVGVGRMFEPKLNELLEAATETSIYLI